jgi:hypothetical protein
VKRTRTRTERPSRPKQVEDELPDVRDGLTRTERIVLTTLNELTQERGGRSVSTMELWGRLVERIDLSQDELQKILSRLSGRASG